MPQLLDASGNPIQAPASAAKRLPSGLGREVASTGDGKDIFRPFTKGLQLDSDPLLSNAADWGVYDRIYRDDQVKSCWQQRTTALTSRDWRVEAGGESDIDLAAAALLEDNLRRIGWDRISEKMMKAVFNGYSVAELLWEWREGYIQFSAIKVRHARRFRLDETDRLRLLTVANMDGERLPDRKFWFLKAGGDHDDEPYGKGLAHWLYWPVTFKRNGLKFWNTFLDKYGAPTAIGRYRPGTTDGDISNLLQALQAIATDSGIAIPEGMAIDLLEAARSAGADYDKMVDKMDQAIAKVILSQPGTTENQAWAGTAETHAGVRDDVVDADDDLMGDSFMDGPARWFTEINFPGAAVPRVTRKEPDEGEDLNEIADLDAKMKALGFRRSLESVRETYGDEWEPIEQAEAPAAPAENEKPTLGDTDPEFAEPDETDMAANEKARREAGTVDHAAASLMDPARTAPVLDDLLAPLVAAIEAAATEDEARGLLGQIAPNLRDEQLTETIARAGFAVRMEEVQDGI